jgi:hypothetical protein
MGVEMKQPKPKLSDILEYLVGMSNALVKLAKVHQLPVLAEIYAQAALEAALQLEAIAANEAGTQRSQPEHG